MCLIAQKLVCTILWTNFIIYAIIDMREICMRGIWMRCAFQFPLFPTFLLSVPLLVVIWSYPEQGYNSATGHFVWLVRSPGTVYHWTFVLAPTLSMFKSMLKTHLFLHSYFSDWLFRRVRAANIVRCPCSDSSHVINCHFIIIIIYYQVLLVTGQLLTNHFCQF